MKTKIKFTTPDKNLMREAKMDAIGTFNKVIESDRYQEKQFDIGLKITEDGYDLEFENDTLNFDFADDYCDYKANNFKLTLIYPNVEIARDAEYNLRDTFIRFTDINENNLIITRNGARIIIDNNNSTRKLILSTHPCYWSNKDNKFECNINFVRQKTYDQYNECTKLNSTYYNRGKTIATSVYNRPNSYFTSIYGRPESKVIPVFTFGHDKSYVDESIPATSNNFEISIRCKTLSMAKKIGEFIHFQLKGNKDYVDNKVILNCDTEMVYLIISAHSDLFPILLYVEDK